MIFYRFLSKRASSSSFFLSFFLHFSGICSHFSFLVCEEEFLKFFEEWGPFQKGFPFFTHCFFSLNFLFFSLFSSLIFLFFFHSIYLFSVCFLFLHLSFEWLFSPYCGFEKGKRMRSALSNRKKKQIFGKFSVFFGGFRLTLNRREIK